MMAGGGARPFITEELRQALTAAEPGIFSHVCDRYFCMCNQLFNEQTILLQKTKHIIKVDKQAQMMRINKKYYLNIRNE